MYALQPLTADQVLQAFRDDAFNLFLGAAIVAVGVVAAAFSLIRRKYDLVLIYFALFAMLYGSRLWIESDLVALTMRGSPLYPLYVRGSSAFDFTVAIPAFLFFTAAGLMRRQAAVASYVLGIELGLLSLATLAFGPHRIFYRTANVSIIAVLAIVVVRSVRQKSDNQDLTVIRRGGIIFVAFVFMGEP